jgi:hypothetical protein
LQENESAWGMAFFSFLIRLKDDGNGGKLRQFKGLSSGNGLH